MSPSRAPQVSVVMTTYNHERYIEESIRSILSQTLRDFELLVINDGSSDRTAEIAGAFDDPRVRVITQDNQGPSLAFNRGVREARAEWIAIMSGDDVAEPARLERQLAVAGSESGPDVVFSHVNLIDDRSRPTQEDWTKDYFNVPQMSRAQIFRRLFESGNFLCAPSAFVRKQAIVDAGYMDPCLFQLQDYDLWVKLAKKHEFAVIQEPLLRYRVHASNLSSPSLESQRATHVEFTIVARHALTDLPPGFFRKSLGERLTELGLDSSGHPQEIQQGLVLLHHSIPAFRLQGFVELHHVIGEPKVRESWEVGSDYRPFDLWQAIRQTDTYGVPEVVNLNRQLGALLAEHGRFSYRMLRSANRALDRMPLLKSTLLQLKSTTTQVATPLRRRKSRK